MSFKFRVEGTTADGNTFMTETAIEDAHAITDAGTYALAMRGSFRQLTEGKAVFGRPGEDGCKGPYTITKVTIELVRQ